MVSVYVHQPSSALMLTSEMDHAFSLTTSQTAKMFSLNLKSTLRMKNT